MKKNVLFIGALLSSSFAFAAIPYCPGTTVTGSKDAALQYVVSEFATQYGCKIGNNCLLNFAEIKYSIAWSEPCRESAKHGNDPAGSTFVCSNGVCQPLGFGSPSKSY